MGVEIEVVTNPAAFGPPPAWSRCPDRYFNYQPELAAINRALAVAGVGPYPGPVGGVPLCLRARGVWAVQQFAAELGDGAADPPFDHLAQAGLWVPVDFPRVLPTDLPDERAVLGSAVRLKAECEALAALAGFPLTPDPDPAALLGWPDHDRAWGHLYGRAEVQSWCEAHDGGHLLPLAKLHYAAWHAVRTGGLIWFS